MSLDHNALDAIPAITPEREEIALRRQQAGRAAPRREMSGNWLMLALCLLAIVALGGWSYMLHEQLRLAAAQLFDARERVSVLEQRLSVTDESMNQSTDVVQVRLKELDSEVRKLWDNVWKRTKQQQADQDKAIASLQAGLKGQVAQDAQLTTSVAAQQAALAALKTELAENAGVAEDVEKLALRISAQDEALQDMADTVEQVQSSTEEFEQRIAGTEEWVDSFNGYRTQMNRKMLDLQGAIKALQQ